MPKEISKHMRALIDNQNIHFETIMLFSKLKKALQKSYCLNPITGFLNA